MSTKKVLCFSIDQAFSHHLAACLNSIHENNFTNVKIIIFGFKLSSNIKRELLKFKKKSIKEIKVIDVIDQEFSDLPKSDQFTRAAYGRFLATKIANDDEHFLYLDADTIVMQDLEQIFQTDLMNFPVGGVANINKNGLAELLGTSTKAPYLDSGLLLFNIPVWNNLQLSEKILREIKEKGQSWSTPDNHGLNFVLKGNFLPLTQRFSYQTQYYNKYPETKNEGDNAVVLQFAGPIKPDSFFSKDPFRHVYVHHLALTHFARKIHADKTVINFIKNFIKKIRSGA